MSYEVYYRYAGGGISHYMKTASRRIARNHLLAILDEDEVRGLASHIVMTHNGKLILEAHTAVDTESILSAVAYPRVGAPPRKHKATTLAVYIPEAASDYIRQRGNGSPSAGMEAILIEVGGEEMARAFNMNK